MHPNLVRGPIEAEHNRIRDDREQEYVAARNALEAEYHSDLADINTAKRQALVAAGLNSDGGVPPTFDVNIPVNKVAPAITGTPTSTNTMTCSEGTWTDADSFTYQWTRDGVAIGGATANTRVLAGADVSHVIRCVVTAHNESGTASANSNSVTPAS